MLFKNNNILESNQYQKCDKPPFIIYADLKCIIEKMDVRIIPENNLQQN